MNASHRTRRPPILLTNGSRHGGRCWTVSSGLSSGVVLPPSNYPTGLGTSRSPVTVASAPVVGAPVAAAALCDRVVEHPGLLGR